MVATPQQRKGPILWIDGIVLSHLEELQHSPIEELCDMGDAIPDMLCASNDPERGSREAAPLHPTLAEAP